MQTNKAYDLTVLEIRWKPGQTHALVLRDHAPGSEDGREAINGLTFVPNHPVPGTQCPCVRVAHL